MRILLLVSTKQDGFDPLIGQLAVALAAPGNVVTTLDVDNDRDSKQDIFAQKFDTVVMLNDMEWYLGNRVHLKGRFKTCMVSFQFEPLMPMLTMPLSELGIDYFITNCRTFDNQLNVLHQSTFMHKPYINPGNSSDYRGDKIGAVLSNVADRDFSLLARVYSKLQHKNLSSRFLLAVPEAEQLKLPAPFRGIAEVVRFGSETAMSQYMRELIAFTLCPRITDYRAGIIPTDFIEAVASGCRPLAISHQVFDPIRPLLTTMPDSLKSFDAELDRVIDAEFTVSLNYRRDLKEFTAVKVSDLANKVLEKVR